MPYTRWIYSGTETVYGYDFNHVDASGVDTNNETRAETGRRNMAGREMR